MLNRYSSQNKLYPPIHFNNQINHINVRPNYALTPRQPPHRKQFASPVIIKAEKEQIKHDPYKAPLIIHHNPQSPKGMNSSTLQQKKIKI